MQVAKFHSKCCLQREKVSKRKEHKWSKAIHMLPPKAQQWAQPWIFTGNTHAYFHPKGTCKPMKIQSIASVLSQFHMLWAIKIANKARAIPFALSVWLAFRASKILGVTFWIFQGKQAIKTTVFHAIYCWSNVFAVRGKKISIYIMQFKITILLLNTVTQGKTKDSLP